MMNAVSSLNPLNTVSAAELVGRGNPAALNKEELNERQAFDRFVGGTFYRQ